MNILNLYAGIGGNRKLWGDSFKITAVELDEKIARDYGNLYPNDKVIVADAHIFLQENYKDFDFIWSSPPCPSHSKIRNSHKKKIFPDFRLYEEIFFLNKYFNGLYVVENVKPYYEPLIEPTTELDRHLFWSNFPITNKEFASLKNFSKGTKEKERLSIFHGIDHQDLKAPDKRKLLRNCVNPRVGVYILEQAIERTIPDR